MLAASVKNRVETMLGVPIGAVRPVSGGDIHQAFQLHTKEGGQWLVKTNRHALAADMFRTEAQGLALLGASRVIRTPRTLGHGITDDGQGYLLMEFIESGDFVAWLIRVDAAMAGILQIKPSLRIWACPVN